MSGLNIDPNALDPSVSNIEYGDDFVRDTPYADVVFLSWVNKGISNPYDSKVGTESPLLKKGHTWKGALLSSRPAFIAISTNNTDCVGTDDIPKDEYQLIIGQEHDYTPSCIYVRSDLLMA